jgi:nucleoside-diphosphate-sugar epimerase
MKILVIGCGFLGSYVAEALKKKASVTVTKTSSPCPIKDVHFELLKPSTYSKIRALVEDFDVIIVTASAGGYSYETSYLCLARRIVNALKPYRNKTLIYTSSSGVYKESSGGLADENSQLDLDNAHVLIDTEKSYLSLKNTRVVINIPKI